MDLHSNYRNSTFHYAKVYCCKLLPAKFKSDFYHAFFMLKKLNFLGKFAEILIFSKTMQYGIK